ncbi:MAG: enoyl-CoA hydratase/isomerase family protein [Desulfobacteraceae bacterium]|jgi:2-(1,2-epoxy-1,2-dihydrophenyl)acetyl-CoA isomerase|nr:MAG: enoyl-CoA hydratase/isomerase family protein [Desulfobacteraceae bacterium]
MERGISIVMEKDVAVFMLNRPEAYNSFDLEMIKGFAGKLTSLALDDSLAGIVISGQGNAFCAGGDLRWIAGHPGGYSQAFHELAASYHQAILEIRRISRPVVAAINGLAAGGGFSLALACDFRIMERGAVLKQAYTSNGLSIDGGGTYSLPRLVGLARAMEIAVFDRPIDAEKALAWGLVTEVVEKGRSLERAISLTQDLASRSLPSFAASKKLLSNSFDTSLEAQLEMERHALAQCASTPQAKEGLTAFIEKRKPVYGKGQQVRPCRNG